MSYSNRTNYGVEEGVLDSGKFPSVHDTTSAPELEFESMEWKLRLRPSRLKFHN